MVVRLDDKHLCDLISICLVSLHMGVIGGPTKNRDSFVGEFCVKIENNETLANTIYDYLSAIAVGMLIAR